MVSLGHNRIYTYTGIHWWLNWVSWYNGMHTFDFIIMVCIPLTLTPRWYTKLDITIMEKQINKIIILISNNTKSTCIIINKQHIKLDRFSSCDVLHKFLFWYTRCIYLKACWTVIRNCYWSPKKGHNKAFIISYLNRVAGLHWKLLFYCDWRCHLRLVWRPHWCLDQRNVLETACVVLPYKICYSYTKGQTHTDILSKQWWWSNLFTHFCVLF